MVQSIGVEGFLGMWGQSTDIHGQLTVPGTQGQIVDYFFISQLTREVHTYWKDGGVKPSTDLIRNNRLFTQTVD